MEFLTQQDLDNLTEIQRLLDEGLKHYLTYESHCKSSEGYVAVTIEFGNSWERFAGPVKPKISISVYSYVLGPNRSHDFDDTEMALWAVQGWYDKEMRYDPFTPENIKEREEFDQFAAQWVEDMQASGKLTVVELGDE